MATIREDVVRVSFEVENSPFRELMRQMEAMRGAAAEAFAAVGGGVSSAMRGGELSGGGMLAQLAAAGRGAVAAAAGGAVEAAAGAEAALSGVGARLLGALRAGFGAAAGGAAALPAVDTAQFTAGLGFAQLAVQNTQLAFSTVFTGMGAGMAGFALAAQAHGLAAGGSVAAMAGSMRATLAGLDLSGEGTRIMQGLLAGINAQKSAIMGVVAGIAAGIRNTLRSAMDIHSPSRVTMELGAYIGEGLARGMEGTAPRVQGAGGALAAAALPVAARAPEAGPAAVLPVAARQPDTSPAASAAAPTYVTNNNNPQFTLTIGGSATAGDRDLERQVRAWIAESFERVLADANRGAPRKREV